MARKNPDEEAARKRAKAENKAVDRTEKKVNKLNKKDLTPEQKLRKLLEDD